jgi:hypothetical protein
LHAHPAWQLLLHRALLTDHPAGCTGTRHNGRGEGRSVITEHPDVPPRPGLDMYSVDKTRNTPCELSHFGEDSFWTLQSRNEQPSLSGLPAKMRHCWSGGMPSWVWISLLTPSVLSLLGSTSSVVVVLAILNVTKICMLATHRTSCWSWHTSQSESMHSSWQPAKISRCMCSGPPSPFLCGLVRAGLHHDALQRCAVLLRVGRSHHHQDQCRPLADAAAASHRVSPSKVLPPAVR